MERHLDNQDVFPLVVLVCLSDDVFLRQLSGKEDGSRAILMIVNQRGEEDPMLVFIGSLIRSPSCVACFVAQAEKNRKSVCVRRGMNICQRAFALVS